MSMSEVETVDRKAKGDARRLVERAYAHIRQAILLGQAQPGAHLAEESLAETIGLSRTPVREALRRLAREGLVVLESNGRSYVARFSPMEMQSIFEIRARLESYACELAAERIREGEIERLQEICTEIETLGPVVSNHALIRFMDLNSAFHNIILDIAGSRNLRIAAAPAIAVPLVLLKHYVWHETVDVVRSNAQHRELIAALSARNPAWASACMANHINSTRPVAPA